MQSSYNPLRYLHILVTSLQVLGLFPYRWSDSAPRCPPQFNMGLFLWLVFTRMIVLSGLLLTFSDVLAMPQDSVGSITLLVSLAVSNGSLVLSCFLLVYSSPNLKTTLLGLDRLYPEVLRSVDVPFKSRWVDNLVPLVLVFTLAPSDIHKLVLTSTSVNTPVSHKVLRCFYWILLLGACQVVFFIFDALLKVFGRHLTESVLEVTSNAARHSPPGPPPSQGHSAAANIHKMTQLFELEAQIRKVETLLEEAIFFLGGVVSIQLLNNTILIISGLCTVVHKGLTDDTLIPFTAAGAVWFLCTSAQLFINKIKKVTGLLKDYSCTESDASIKGQVQLLIHRLDHLAKFDILGCYSLGFSTLVSVGSFVATYVVVLLQVGWLPHHGM